MKKVLSILGLIFFCFALIAAIIGSVTMYKGKVLDKESREYIDEVVPAILSSFNKDNFFKYCCKEYLDAVPMAEFEKMFTFSERLGRFVKYNGAQGQSRVYYGPQGKFILADYVAQTEFEVGAVRVEIGLIKQGDVWRVRGLRLNQQF